MDDNHRDGRTNLRATAPGFPVGWDRDSEPLCAPISNMFTVSSQAGDSTRLSHLVDVWVAALAFANQDPGTRAIWVASENSEGVALAAADRCDTSVVRTDHDAEVRDIAAAFRIPSLRGPAHSRLAAAAIIGEHPRVRLSLDRVLAAFLYDPNDRLFLQVRDLADEIAGSGPASDFDFVDAVRHWEPVLCSEPEKRRGSFTGPVASLYPLIGEASAQAVLVSATNRGWEHLLVAYTAAWSGQGRRSIVVIDDATVVSVTAEMLDDLSGFGASVVASTGCPHLISQPLMAWALSCPTFGVFDLTGSCVVDAQLESDGCWQVGRRLTEQRYRRYGVFRWTNAPWAPYVTIHPPALSELGN